MILCFSRETKGKEQSPWSELDWISVPNSVIYIYVSSFNFTNINCRQNHGLSLQVGLGIGFFLPCQRGPVVPCRKLGRERSRERGQWVNVNSCKKAPKPSIKNSMYDTVPKKRRELVHLYRWGGSHEGYLATSSLQKHAWLVLFAATISLPLSIDLLWEPRLKYYYFPSLPHKPYSPFWFIPYASYVGLRGWSCQHDLVKQTPSLSSLTPCLDSSTDPLL